MRKNHNNHPARKVRAIDKYDRVYIDAPEISGVRVLVAVPVKAIYINIAAEPWAGEKHFADSESLSNYIDRKGITLP